MHLGVEKNDNFLRYIKHYQPKTVVLVEANPSLIEAIHKNYRDVQSICNVVVVNKAIYTEDNKEVSLYLPAEDGIYGKPRRNASHVYSHGEFSLLPMNDWGDKTDMIEVKATAITFDKLCTDLGITTIDYLQIDTEGFDSEIINSIDLEKYHIRAIRYEKWNFDPECFTKYHSEHCHKYGKNGMKLVQDKLDSHHYKLIEISDQDGNDIIAIKQRNMQTV